MSLDNTNSKQVNLGVSSLPLLSISIPTYNRAQCLGRLLAILHEQSANDPRVELIVSDNASKDGTREMAEDFLRRGMKLRYVRNDVNVGGDENIRRCSRWRKVSTPGFLATTM